jgi:hypothetical protein
MLNANTLRPFEEAQAQPQLIRARLERRLIELVRPRGLADCE